MPWQNGGQRAAQLPNKKQATDNSVTLTVTGKTVLADTPGLYQYKASPRSRITEWLRATTRIGLALSLLRLPSFGEDSAGSSGPMQPWSRAWLSQCSASISHHYYSWKKPPNKPRRSAGENHTHLGGEETTIQKSSLTCPRNMQCLAACSLSGESPEPRPADPEPSFLSSILYHFLGGHGGSGQRDS